MDISIIIVNYNTRALLSDCLSSIKTYSLSPLEYEIIVVDNNSTDDSVEFLKNTFPEVILIIQDQNLGFGSANNLGLKHAAGEYILYLNSDTLFKNDVLKCFYDFMKSTSLNIGVCGCRMRNLSSDYNDSNGCFPSITLYLKQLFSYIIRKKYECQKKINENDTFVEVDYVIGADMFMERNIALKYKFDENIFMYVEETELQFRLYKDNFKNVLINTPILIHLEGGSSKTKEKELAFKIPNMTVSLFYFIKKHYSIYYYYLFRIVYIINQLPVFFSKSIPVRLKKNYIKILLFK